MKNWSGTWRKLATTYGATREVVGGQDWWHTIVGRIRTCNVFLVALSPALLDSAACSAELSYANDLNKLILPVRVADGFSPALLNSVLARTQMVDYYPPTVGAAIRLMRAITDLPAPNPIPVPEPSPPPAPLSYLSALRDRLESATPMTEPEQAGVVLTLRQSSRNLEEVADARTLLKSMRVRPELFARIADEIDETLRITEPRVVAAPTAAAANPTASPVVVSGVSPTVSPVVSPTANPATFSPANDHQQAPSQRRDRPRSWRSRAVSWRRRVDACVTEQQQQKCVGFSCERGVPRSAAAAPTDL